MDRVLFKRSVGRAWGDCGRDATHFAYSHVTVISIPGLLMGGARRPGCGVGEAVLTELTVKADRLTLFTGGVPRGEWHGLCDEARDAAVTSPLWLVLNRTCTFP